MLALGELLGAAPLLLFELAQAPAQVGKVGLERARLCLGLLRTAREGRLALLATRAAFGQDVALPAAGVSAGSGVVSLRHHAQARVWVAPDVEVLGSASSRALL